MFLRYAMEETILRDYQRDALTFLKQHYKGAAFMEMGLGKTFVGSEMIKDWMSPQYQVKHVIVLCQLSKVKDWIEHLFKYLPDDIDIINGRADFPKEIWDGVLVINYDLAITTGKKEFFSKIIKSKTFNPAEWGVICDESSVLQHRTTRRSELMIGTDRSRKTGLGTAFQNSLLLSGTPCNGKYENLWVQAKILGYEGSYKEWLDMTCQYSVHPEKKYYEIYDYIDGDIINRILGVYGAYFLRAEEVLNLPPVQDITVRCSEPSGYKELRKTGIYKTEYGDRVVADTTLKKYMEERKLLAMNKNKYNTLNELLESTDERVIVFTNFVAEYNEIKEMCVILNKPASFINGSVKDLTNYHNNDNSVTIVQYQAGSMGLNLQKASIMIMASPPVSCEHYMQSRGRIYREGQVNTCRYYEILGGRLEENIYESLKRGQDFTLDLYEEWGKT